LPTPETRPRAGPKTLANPQLTGVGKTGVQGAKPPWQGVWGVPPKKQKEGASCPHLNPRHEWDPKRWRTLSLRGWAKGGARGMCPHKKTRVGKIS